MDYLKLKSVAASAQALPVERISARIIMTHTQNIINLACIIRKHESSQVIKVLLVVLLSSLCPDALFVLPAHCWSFTERALICVAAWLLTYCLYVQSWLIMKSFRRKEMNKLKSGWKFGVKFDSDKGIDFKLNYFMQSITLFDSLMTLMCLDRNILSCTKCQNTILSAT